MAASWIPVSAQSDFPIENLPYGAFASHGTSRLGVAIGERILDLHAVAEAGLFNGICDPGLLSAPVLNSFLAAGRPVWNAVRKHLTSLLADGADATSALRERNADAFFVGQNEVKMRVPMEIGDYVDFYSSIEHATNVGKIFRPDGEPLTPNWRWLPIGYHGRSNTIAIDGTPVIRPCGQRKPPSAAVPSFGPSEMLDIELEMAFVTGSSSAQGTPIPIAGAREHIFGLMLLNDWSARDIQAWEYQPLGPFLGKSFATTLSPWVVTLDALAPFASAPPVQDPEPLAYLRRPESAANGTFDIELEVSITTQSMRERHADPQVIARSNFKYLYWTMEQQLAHATSNGAAALAGDLFASGTISGPEPKSFGSLLEMTWRGTKPIVLASGEERAFLEDGDEIVLRGRCVADGVRSIGFGCARGTIVPASPLR